MTEQVAIKNPLLERATMPGETFTLPSLGIFYNTGEVTADVKGGEVYIIPMRTIDEITLKSPDKLYSGVAIDDVIKRCVPQILRPMDLLAKDVDFILTALRKISYGSTSEIQYNHNCSDNSKNHSYNLDMNTFLSQTRKIDPTTIEVEYTKKLSNGQVIKLSPPRFLASLKIYQSAIDEKNVEITQLESDVINSIASMIESTDDISDKNMIREWLTILPTSLMHEIKSYIQNFAEWGTDFKSSIICKDCGEKVDITSEINPISFFFEY